MLTLGELWKFLRSRKKLGLVPLILVACAIGGVLLLAQCSAIALFIYTLL